MFVFILQSPLESYLDVVKSKVNSLCEGLQPWQIVVYACGGTLIVIATKNLLFNEEESELQKLKIFMRNCFIIHHDSDLINPFDPDQYLEWYTLSLHLEHTIQVSRGERVK